MAYSVVNSCQFRTTGTWKYHYQPHPRTSWLYSWILVTLNRRLNVQSVGKLKKKKKKLWQQRWASERKGKVGKGWEGQDDRQGQGLLPSAYFPGWVQRSRKACSVFYRVCCDAIRAVFPSFLGLIQVGQRPIFITSLPFIKHMLRSLPDSNKRNDVAKRINTNTEGPRSPWFRLQCTVS